MAATIAQVSNAEESALTFRKSSELRRLLNALHRRGDFENAAKVRATLDRVEYQRG